MVRGKDDCTVGCLGLLPVKLKTVWLAKLPRMRPPLMNSLPKPTTEPMLSTEACPPGASFVRYKKLLPGFEKRPAAGAVVGESPATNCGSKEKRCRATARLEI